MELHKPILMSERKPVEAGRYIVETYSGLLITRRWNPRTGQFTKIDNSQIWAWYKRFDLPSAEDMQYIAGDRIPAGVHPNIRDEQLRGVRLCMESLIDIIGKV